MKKLMIAAAIASVAIFANAASVQWTWSISGTNPLMNPGSAGGQTDVVAAGQAYMFADLTTEQIKAIVSSFNAGTLSLSGYEQNQTLANGVLSSKVTWTDSRKPGDVVDFTMIVTSTIDGKDYLFIDDVSYADTTRNADLVNKNLTFKELEASKKAALDAKDGFVSGAHWYSAAAVPEPTSGLLLLLGVAGLALRRRRA